VRLRPSWREAKRPPASRADGGAAGGKAGTKAKDAKDARAAALPSRTRVLANVVVGLVVTVASLAALLTRG
jgi:hypothetical protein